MQGFDEGFLPFEEMDDPGNEPVEVVLAGIVDEDEIGTNFDQVVNRVHQQLRCVQHHLFEFGCQCDFFGVLDELVDETEQEVGTDGSIDVVGVEGHLLDVPDGFVLGDEPSRGQDQRSSLVFGCGVVPRFVEEASDDVVSSGVDFIGFFVEGHVGSKWAIGVLEGSGVELVFLVVETIPEIVMGGVRFLQESQQC